MLYSLFFSVPETTRLVLSDIWVFPAIILALGMEHILRAGRTAAAARPRSEGGEGRWN